MFGPILASTFLAADLLYDQRADSVAAVKALIGLPQTWEPMDRVRSTLGHRIGQEEAEHQSMAAVEAVDEEQHRQV
jgi:hypothetical protein